MTVDPTLLDLERASAARNVAEAERIAALRRDQATPSSRSSFSYRLGQNLLERTSGILAAIVGIVVVAMLLTAFWSVRTQAHERCIEALKDPGVSDVVRMSICTR